jgi:7-carboxy-7-deazaguanine synthase (Cx14CxxC type)
MSTYAVKEVFFTRQGEGARTGRPAVFCRFARCNLWSGREADRAGAICRFCDTDFVGTDGPGGGVFREPDALADHVAEIWRDGAIDSGPAIDSPPYVVCTGGEPLLQLDTELIDAMHDRGFEVAIETNGTLPVPVGVDWVCVSPKAHTDLVVDAGDELKLVHPQPGAEPERYEHLAFDHFFLAPMDGPDRATNTRLALEHCSRQPEWQLSLQTHKLIGIP